MTNANDPIHPYAWQMGEDGKTAIINTNPVQLTKREYFAAIAMQGILSMTKGVVEGYVSKTAKSSVIIADALIAALNEKEA